MGRSPRLGFRFACDQIVHMNTSGLTYRPLISGRQSDYLFQISPRLLPLPSPAAAPSQTDRRGTGHRHFQNPCQKGASTIPVGGDFQKPSPHTTVKAVQRVSDLSDDPAYVRMHHAVFLLCLSGGWASLGILLVVSFLSFAFLFLWLSLFSPSLFVALSFSLWPRSWSSYLSTPFP